MSHVQKFFLWLAHVSAELMLDIEARFHAVDAYLADLRGEKAFSADCLSRVHECERRIATLRLNKPC